MGRGGIGNDQFGEGVDYFHAKMVEIAEGPKRPVMGMQCKRSVTFHGRILGFLLLGIIQPGAGFFICLREQ